MKINGLNINSYYPYTSDVSKLAASASLKPKRTVQSFDKVTLTGRPAEETFASELKARISQEVHKAASAQDLDELKAQIANGTYQLDLETVAKKMLLL